MGTLATGTFEITSWTETPGDQVERGPRLARARVTEVFRGDIEGEGTAECLLVYCDDGSISFAQMLRVVGRLGERQGSFVLRVNGRVEGGTAKATWHVVPGTGTHDLRGLRGVRVPSSLTMARSR